MRDKIHSHLNSTVFSQFIYSHTYKYQNTYV